MDDVIDGSAAPNYPPLLSIRPLPHPPPPQHPQQHPQQHRQEQQKENRIQLAKIEQYS